MGSTNIAGLAKAMLQEQSQKVQPERSTEENAVDFAEVMGQMAAQTGDDMFSENMLSGAKTVVSGSKESAEMSYEKYQYRRSEIKSQDVKAKQPEEQEISEGRKDFEKDVKEIIQENLGVTEEQLEEAMEALGITYLDLMNPQQLASLTAELTGGEELEVLFDSNFLQMMQEISELSNALLESLGVSVEELKELTAVMDTTAVAESGDMTENLTDGSLTQEMDAADLQQQIGPQEQTTADVTETKSETGQESLITGKENAAELQETQKPAEEETLEDTGRDALIETISTGDSAEDSVLQEETSDSGQNDSQNKPQSQMPNQQTQNQGVLDTPVRQNDITETPVTQSAEGNFSYSTQMDIGDVIRQIVTYTQVHITDQNATLEMQLNPQHLGKLFLELTSHEGTVSARIFTQNELVKEALEMQMADLKQSMNQAGIKVEAVEVTVESHEFERNLEEQANQEQKQAEEQERAAKQTRKIHLNEMGELEGVSGVMTEEETLVAQMMAEQGNSVDFMA